MPPCCLAFCSCPRIIPTEAQPPAFFEDHLINLPFSIMETPKEPGAFGLQNPQIRFLVACPRSGSTLLMRIFAQSPDCAVTSRLILMGNAAEGSGTHCRPDYTILEDPERHIVYIQARNSQRRFLVSKEELGNNSNKGECLYDLCSSPAAYTMTRPIFLIRDPVRVFDSWKKLGWTDVSSLVDCYTNIFRMLGQSSAYAISCLLYEKLVQDPQTEIKQICRRWGVPYLDAMLHFKKPFASSFIFPTERERTIYCEEKPLGIFSTLEASTSVITDVPTHGLLSNDEKDYIEEQVGRSYVRCWQDEALRLRATLLEKSWIGFDLDDTLHEFRRASSAATEKVLTEIAGQHGIPAPALREEYAKILHIKTANAFSDGKTSFDYRKERFILLLEKFSLEHDSDFLARLLDAYEATLVADLELKCGARGVLSTVKNMGKKIVIVTEGPQDAQERTIDALGIRPYVDFLATTNRFQLSKTDGLFAKVLQHLRISSGDMAYIGNNEQRDMVPAMASGIFSFHLAEGKNTCLSSFPPRINTLRKLQYILCA
jgi:FMN phosphatase YigB (HAD superfamily)